jgi:hypothetical protein
MKKAFLMLSLMIVGGSVGWAGELPVSGAVPPIFQKFIGQSQDSCEYRALAPLPGRGTSFPEVITPAQATEDVAMIRYLFETAYSGTTYWKRQGVDFDGMYAALGALCQASGPIVVKRLEEILDRYLEPIQDGHLSIIGRSRHRFFRHEDPYFADLLLEESGDGFVVVASREPELVPGEKVSVARHQVFPTLAPEGKKHVLVGCLSSRPRSRIFLHRASGARVSVNLHPCRLADADFADESVFRLDAVERIPHVRVCSFDSAGHGELVQFEKTAQTLQSAQDIILNLHGNSGGSSRYGANWVQSLNGFVQSPVSTAVLYSPAVVEGWANENLEDASPYLQQSIRNFRRILPELRQKPRRVWEYHSAQATASGSGFPGRVVVLINRNVASSGELTTAYAKSFPRHLLVGENSAGIGTFGEVRQYALAHSKMRFFLPSKLFLEPGIREGRGYVPDFWLDTSDPLKEIARWIRYPREYRFEFDVPQPVTAIDFEAWENGIPKGMRRSVGVTFGPGKKFGRLVPDEANACQGKLCGLLTGDTDAANWHYFNTPLPLAGKEIAVTFSVKGENIHLEPGQIENSYIGFSAVRKDGKREWRVNAYTGTFGWKKETMVLPRPADYQSVSFAFMLSMAGKLWIDDIRFSTTP